MPKTPRVALCLSVLVVFCGLSCERARQRPLPRSFAASITADALRVEHGLVEVWSVQHPEYPSPLRVLLASSPVRGTSPNYTIGFYQRRDDRFDLVDQPFELGGFKRPQLSTLPGGSLPAIVAEAEAIPERTYFFVRGGKVQSESDDEEGWTVLKEGSKESGPH